MKITADTNVLVRAVVGDDDPAQSPAAISALREAGKFAVALPALCEWVWVLRREYGRSCGRDQRGDPGPDGGRQCAARLCRWGGGAGAAGVGW